MRHQVAGKAFGRNTSHRLAMFRNMANSAIREERITTTVVKAKELRKFVDRLITLAKKGTPQARRLAFDRTRDKEVVAKLFDSLAGRYKSRNGGYTRVLKLSELRRGDGAEMALFELVDHPGIDRKRRVAKPAGEATEGATDQAAGVSASSSTDVDPFKKYRKLFGKTSKKPAKKATAGVEKAPKAKAAKKPAKRVSAKKAKSS